MNNTTTNLGAIAVDHFIANIAIMVIVISGGGEAGRCEIALRFIKAMEADTAAARRRGYSQIIDTFAGCPPPATTAPRHHRPNLDRMYSLNSGNDVTTQLGNGRVAVNSAPRRCRQTRSDKCVYLQQRMRLIVRAASTSVQRRRFSSVWLRRTAFRTVALLAASVHFVYGCHCFLIPNVFDLSSKEQKPPSCAAVSLRSALRSILVIITNCVTVRQQTYCILFLFPFASYTSSKLHNNFSFFPANSFVARCQ